MLNTSLAAQFKCSHKCCTTVVTLKEAPKIIMYYASLESQSLIYIPYTRGTG